VNDKQEPIILHPESFRMRLVDRHRLAWLFLTVFPLVAARGSAQAAAPRVTAKGLGF
jgi:hypothetical protein